MTVFIDDMNMPELN